MSSVAFDEASRVLASVRDVVAERPGGADPPAWCERRGWTPFLAALSPDEVQRAELDGLAAHVASFPGAPADLVDLARAVVALTTLPTVDAMATADVDPRRASPRKRSQVAAFAALVGRVGVSPSRVVDLGSGHGHLTRHLAGALGVEAEGWERDAARVAVAAALARDGGARFVTLDARDAAGALRSTDLVVGLHACGALGDLAVRAAGAAGAAVAVVGCCLQKREGDREPLVVPSGMTAAELTLGRSVLGLGNARDGDDGVEEDLATRTTARVHRMALRAALLAHGMEIGAGEEMRGVNRRRASGSLDALVASACALRGVAPPTVAAIAEAGRWAAETYEGVRRWSLPRTMVARLVEVWVALDRAAWLSSAGYASEVVRAFDASLSPRNVAVLGRPM